MTDKKIKSIFIDGPIKVEQISQSLLHHQAKTNIGAHAMFMGQVRADMINEQSVTGIEYTAYCTMADELMTSIREETFQQFPLTCMHIYHSLGYVPTGQICLFVFTSSAHRRAALDACDYVVERIKNELPIWGKEILTDTQTQWKKNR